MARKFTPIQFGSLVKAGDIPHIPGDVSEEMLNVFHRPGPRVEKRAPWKSDVLGSNPVTGAGYMLWEDTTNREERLILDNGDIYIKALKPSENWGAAIVGAQAGVTDFANDKGAIYWVVPDIGTPQTYKYDGTALDTNPFRTFSSAISARSIVAWKDRLWLIGFLTYITNKMLLAHIYGAAGFFLTNVVVKSVTSNGITLVSWTPTSTTSAKAEYVALVVAASSEEFYFVLRSDILGVAPVFRVPMTLEVFVAQTAPRGTNVLVGTIRRPTASNGFRYRVIQAGVTGAGEPAWNVTPGTDTNDGAAIWHNDGPEAFVSHFFEVENADDNGGDYQTEAVLVRLPPMPANMTVGFRWKWGTDARPTWDLQQVVVGKLDGLADGDPRKKNFGIQITEGKYVFDFVNTESTTSVLKKFPNRIVATEAGIPGEILNDVFFDVVDGEGGLVVGRPLNDLMCVYKRTCISVYRVVTDAKIAVRLPMQYVATFQAVGCIHQRAIDDFENLHYFIGEEDCYVFDGASNPIRFTTDAMREAIFDRAGGKWCEDVGRAPLLRIDKKNREVRIRTQRDKDFVYNIDSKKWTSVYVAKDGAGGRSDVIDSMYHREKFYAIANNNALVREDSAGTQDEVYSAGVVTGYDVIAEVWLHPFEQVPRADVLIESVEIHHKITGVQGASTLEAAVSFDRGATFPVEHTITVPVTTDRNPIIIPLYQGGADMVIRLRHSGKAGPTYFNAFWAGVWTQDLGMETNDTIPVTTAVAL